MATMGILYYRIAQSGFGEEMPEDEQQLQQLQLLQWYIVYTFDVAWALYV